jgi:hypothetical protein
MFTFVLKKEKNACLNAMIFQKESTRCKPASMMWRILL